MAAMKRSYTPAAPPSPRGTLNRQKWPVLAVAAMVTVLVVRLLPSPGGGREVVFAEPPWPSPAAPPPSPPPPPPPPAVVIDPLLLLTSDESAALLQPLLAATNFSALRSAALLDAGAAAGLAPPQLGDLMRAHQRLWCAAQGPRARAPDPPNSTRVAFGNVTLFVYAANDVVSQNIAGQAHGWEPTEVQEMLFALRSYYSPTQRALERRLDAAEAAAAAAAAAAAGEDGGGGRGEGGGNGGSGGNEEQPGQKREQLQEQPQQPQQPQQQPKHQRPSTQQQHADARQGRAGDGGSRSAQAQQPQQQPQQPQQPTQGGGQAAQQRASSSSPPSSSPPSPSSPPPRPSASLLPPPLVVDVGANVGWFALNAAAAGARCAAFEAMPANVRLLRGSLCANPWLGDRIALFGTGLGPKRDTCGVLSGVTNAGDGWTVCGGRAAIEQRLRDANSKARFENETYAIRGDDIDVRRLDALVDEDVQFLKADVEGFELQVLEGAEGLLRRRRVWHLMIEANPDIVGAAGVAKYLGVLDAAGYAVSEKGFRGPFISPELIRAGQHPYAGFNLYGVRRDLKEARDEAAAAARMASVAGGGDDEAGGGAAYDDGDGGGGGGGWGGGEDGRYGAGGGGGGVGGGVGVAGLDGLVGGGDDVYIDGNGGDEFGPHHHHHHHHSDGSVDDVLFGDER